MRVDAAERNTVHFLIITIALAVVAVSHLAHGLPFMADDQGQYLSHARTLIEGRPYTDIGYIYTNYNNFIGPVAEPPGFPLLIAPALAISGPDLLPVRAVLLFSLAAFLLLAWTFAKDVSGRWIATAAIIFTVTMFAEQHALDGVLADLPFCAAIWCVILAANTSEPLSRARLVAMAVAGSVAFTFRMAALPLLPAIVLMMFLRPRRDRAGLALVGAVWIATAWLVMFGMPTSSALVAETARDGSRILGDVGANLKTIRFSVLEAFLYPFPSNLANDIYHVVALPIAGVGAWSLARANPRRFAFLFAISTVGMLLVLPTRSTRYWWPLAPLQALALMHGVDVLLRRRPAVSRWATGAVASLVFISGAVSSRYEPATPLFERSDIIELVARLRAESRLEPARAVIFSPRTFTWHTGIPAMGMFDADPDETLAELHDKRIGFVFLGPLGQSSPGAQSVARAISQRPESFHRIATAGELELYRVLR